MVNTKITFLKEFKIKIFEDAYLFCAWAKVTSGQTHMRLVLIKTCIKLITFSYTQIPSLSMSLFNTHYFPDWTDSVTKITSFVANQIYTAVETKQVWPTCILGGLLSWDCSLIFYLRTLPSVAHHKIRQCIVCQAKKNNACYVPHLNNIIALIMKSARRSNSLMKSGSIN